MTETNLTRTDPASPTPGILIPLPDRDFDPSECSAPWTAFASRGWRVAFSTENGSVAQADPYKLNGPLPGLLSASEEIQAAYRQMTQDPAYRRPIPYAEVDPAGYEALVLPGGDGPGMAQYLDNSVLRGKVLGFWRDHKLIGAICHGTLVAARTVDPKTGHSILYGHKVTALPKWLDRTVHLLDSWLLKRGYVFYGTGVADEVRACLASREDFLPGPSVWVPYVVADGDLVTSRHNMEAQAFAERFANEIEQRMRARSGAV